MQSIMKHDFSKVPTIQAERSSFDRSFGHKTTINAGDLVPFYIDDVLPGDTFNCKTTGFARMATPIWPIMDNMYMDTHFFFVPLRLVWDNSRKFFGEQANPADSIDYQLPTFTAFTPGLQSIHDYMGLPPVEMTPVSLYARAYNLIWNEWFRDQNLQDSIVVDTDDGPDDSADYVIQKRGKRHDYFTSCLPWPQKGDAATLFTGTGIAPVHGIASASASWVDGAPSGFKETDGSNASTYPQYKVTNTASSTVIQGDRSGTTGEPEINVDLTEVLVSDINQLREAFQIQRLLERDARGGTRYSELVNNHFGVKFYDVSYRPEYLGGGSTPVNTTPIAQTGPSGGFSLGEGIGTVSGFTTAGFSNHGFTKSFVEHGIIIGLVSVRADLTYQQGISRNFLKSTRYDMYWPTLAHLGEQAVTNAEIYYTNTATDDDVFGYQERYAEYRYKPSQISGQFRSASAFTLDAWHLSQEFGSLPTLGDTFIKETPPMARVQQVSANVPDFILDTYTSLRCARPMPVYSVPGMIDHF